MYSAAHKARGQGDRLPAYYSTNDVPTVDILVTYCGEGLDLITDTIKACCTLDYPQSLYRVIVLDDSHSTELAEHVTYLKREYLALYYASRKVLPETHSKAANLNFGIRYAENLPGGKSEYVAVLDVDMIPVPHWLRAMLPHVHDCPHVGLASTSQNFYNLQHDDPLGIWFEIKMIESLVCLQDYSNSAFCTGSGFVARHRALESIGGIPESSMQEDILTSIKLAARGWETVYILKQHLQWGLAPDTFAGWVNQRQRWAAGVISISQYLSSNEAEGLDWKVRLIGCYWGVIDSSAALGWTITLLCLPVLVMTQQPLISWRGAEQFSTCLGLAFLDFAAQSSTQILLSSLVDFKVPILSHLSSRWTAPYRLAVALRSYVIPKLFGREPPRFRPTNSPIHGTREREARKTGSRVSFLKVILWECGAYLHLIVFVTGLIGCALTAKSILFGFERDHVRSTLRTFLTGVGWPPLFMLWAALMSNAWVPLAYAIFPPPLQSRERFLVRDEKNGVAFPTRQAKDDYIRSGKQGFFSFVCFYYLSMMVLVSYGLVQSGSKYLSASTNL